LVVIGTCARGVGAGAATATVDAAAAGCSKGEEEVGEEDASCHSCSMRVSRPYARQCSSRGRHILNVPHSTRAAFVRPALPAEMSARAIVDGRVHSKLRVGVAAATVVAAAAAASGAGYGMRGGAVPSGNTAAAPTTVVPAVAVVLAVLLLRGGENFVGDHIVDVRDAPRRDGLGPREHLAGGEVANLDCRAVPHTKREKVARWAVAPVEAPCCWSGVERDEVCGRDALLSELCEYF